MSRRSERIGREMDQFQANAQAFGAAQIPCRAGETVEELLAAARLEAPYPQNEMWAVVIRGSASTAVDPSARPRWAGPTAVGRTGQGGDHEVMEQSEAQALAGVRSRLAAQFPDASEDAVDTAMSAARAEMTGPIRDYVPLLVERMVRERLARQLGRHPLPATAGAPQPS